MNFRLIDLVSQREAVREQVKGWSRASVVDWLAVRGRLSSHIVQAREVFFFESAAGCRATFFFDGDEMVFVGDHSTFT